ncbi:hypothetical protein HY771_01110 [Candidatus Uhrbacteria bacterium]|nr:hypothetical protein [Candidatus Uhrbacteria bacterium]
MFTFPELTLPVSIFLLLYGAYLLLFLFYSLFNIYHLIRYGLYGFGLYLIITVFAGGTILLVSGSIFLLMKYDWSQPIFVNGLIETYGNNLLPEGFVEF